MTPQREALEKLKEDGADYMVGILQALYGDQPMDQEQLEHCIEELANLFDLNLPNRDLQVVPANYRGYTQE